MKTLIISEIGVNHDGSFEKLKLVSLSKKLELMLLSYRSIILVSWL